MSSHRSFEDRSVSPGRQSRPRQHEGQISRGRFHHNSQWELRDNGRGSHGRFNGPMSRQQSSQPPHSGSEAPTRRQELISRAHGWNKYSSPTTSVAPNANSSRFVNNGIAHRNEDRGQTCPVRGTASGVRAPDPRSAQISAKPAFCTDSPWSVDEADLKKQQGFKTLDFPILPKLQRDTKPTSNSWEFLESSKGSRWSPKSKDMHSQQGFKKIDLASLEAGIWFDSTQRSLVQFQLYFSSDLPLSSFINSSLSWYPLSWTRNHDLKAGLLNHTQVQWCHKGHCHCQRCSQNAMSQSPMNDS